MEIKEKRSVNCGNTVIDYTLIRKKVKNINIRIKPVEGVVVSAPSYVTAEYIDSIIVRRSEYILKAILKYKREEDSEKNKVIDGGDSLAIFKSILDEKYECFRAYGVRYPGLKARAMKSIWGSCNIRTGVVTLNTRLLAYPRICTEYVVVHELAHFVYPNHSKEFWELVGSIMPEWKKYRQMLRG